MRIIGGFEQTSATFTDEQSPPPHVSYASLLGSRPHFDPDLPADRETEQKAVLMPSHGAPAGKQEIVIDPWVSAKQNEQDAAEAYREARLGALHARIGQWAESLRTSRISDPVYLAALGRLVTANDYEERTATALEHASMATLQLEHPQASALVAVNR